MKALRTIAACVALASAVQAQDKAPGETMTHLFDSAQQELARGSAELAALRTTIDAEKLPMTRELSAQEEQLADLRKLHDTVTRAADAGNLEAPALKSEIKARQEEIAYVGNLLDEYVRNFETKAAVGELARYGAAVESAKEARENPALSSAEKFERQLAFATASIARLFEAIGGMRFPGVGVDLHRRLRRRSRARSPAGAGQFPRAVSIRETRRQGRRN